MSSTIAHMTMSLDGFIAGPRDSNGSGLGPGFLRIMRWVGDLEAGGKDVTVSGGANIVQQALATV